MAHPSKQPRKTIPKQIVSLSKAGKEDEAEIIARYGRELSLNEAHFRDFYSSLDEWQAATRGKRIYQDAMKGEHGQFPLAPEEVEALHGIVKKNIRTLCNLFLRAVINHDRAEIIRLADAAWFFKDKRHPNFRAVDRERTMLLTLGSFLRRNNSKLSIAFVAFILSLDEIAATGKKPKSDDGFSALRRKCKELGVPLAESRKRSKR